MKIIQAFYYKILYFLRNNFETKKTLSETQEKSSSLIERTRPRKMTDETMRKPNLLIESSRIINKEQNQNTW